MDAAFPNLDGTLDEPQPPRPDFRTRLRRSAAVARGFFPFTLTGLLVLALVGYALKHHGIAKLDLLLLMASITAVVILAALLILVLLAGLWLHLTIRRVEDPPVRLSLNGGVWQPTGFELKFPWFFPCIEVLWRWESEAGRPIDMDVKLERVGSRALEMVCPRRRGIFHGVRRTVTVRDVLRLTQLSWGWTSDLEVQLMPGSGHIDGLSLLARFVSGEDLSDPRGDPTGDRVDMRQYARGDSPRTILWKVFARTRKLMVRVPERALTARPRACAYMASGPHDEAGAGLARVILERGLLGDGWRFGADGNAGHCSAAQGALEMLARSGNPEATAQSHIERYLQEAAASGFGSCFIVVPPGGGPHVEKILNAARTSAMRVVLCLGLDHIPLDQPPPPAWKRFLLAPPDGRAEAPTLESIANRWGTGREEVMLVDRSSGNVYNDLHAVVRARARMKEKAGV